MVNSEELRRVVAEYRICEKSSSDKWPAAHQITFEHVESLAKTDLDAYGVGVSSESREPWKRHNINKAAYLAGKSAHLTGSSANESAWRHGIEGVIVKRLSDEVACYVSARVNLNLSMSGNLLHT